MKTVLLLLPENTEREARELLAASAELGCDDPHILAVSRSGTECLRALPTECVSVLPLEETFVPALHVPLLLPFLQAQQAELYLMTGAGVSSDLCARLGAVLGGTCIPAAEDLRTDEDGLDVQIKTLNFQILETRRYTERPFVIRLEKNVFPPAEGTGTPKIVLENRIGGQPASWLHSLTEFPAPQEKSLDRYPVVLCGGNGVGSSEAMKKLRALAERTGCGFGVTRPPVINGWAGIRSLLGVSGVSIASDTLIVFGASGSAAFLGGVDRSKRIIAINCDETARIFQNCDIGITADCGEIIDALTRTIDSQA